MVIHIYLSETITVVGATVVAAAIAADINNRQVIFKNRLPTA